jgi:fatty-acyl-CoA synthase
MEHTMMEFPLTLNHILERAGRLFPESEIVSRMPDRSLHRYRYRDFYHRARALAEALQHAGLQPGDRVATLCWNHYAHLEAYFGIPIAGGVLHTLNLRLHPSELAYIVRHAQDRFLIVDDVLLGLLQAFRDQVSFERIFVVPLKGEPIPPGLESYEDLLASAQGTFQPPELSEGAPAGMCYTSGTTGRPKGVVYSHRSTVLHALVSALSDGLALSNRDSLLPVVPMFHVMAWGLPYTATLVGCKQVLPGPYLDPESLLDLFEQEQVTATAGVPTIWLGIQQALEREPQRWKLIPGMRMVVGGSAAPESLIRGLDAFGLRVVHAWGMTETSPLGTVSWIKANLEERLSEDERYALRAKQGLPVPLIEARVMTPEGEAPWDGTTMGELEVRGPWVAARYYGGEGADRWSPDGWFRTGDVATIDPEGYIKITDRTKDLIKSGGEWISSVELENALMAHPAVKEAAVIAVPHPKWGERPLAVVVLKEGAQVSAEELKAFIAPRFAKFWIPDAVVFVDAIPRTSTGKFLKSKLREEFREWAWA